MYQIAFKRRPDIPALFGYVYFNFVFCRELGITHIPGREEYEFTLVDAVEKCPEFLVHFPTLQKYALLYLLLLLLLLLLRCSVALRDLIIISLRRTRLASEFGMELVMKATFHEYYQESIKNARNVELLRRMQCLDEEGKISADEWECLGPSTEFFCFCFFLFCCHLH